MLTILVLLIGSVSILAVLLLVIVVTGIRQEPPMEELSEQAPSLMAVFVRRFLGVYVRKANPVTTRDLDRRPNRQAGSQMNTGEALFDVRARHAIRVETLRWSKPVTPNASRPRCWRR